MAFRFGFLVFLLAALPIAAHADVTLRPVATVQGATIRLGDLFDGAADRASVVVAAAPPPGGTIVFDANRLAGLAQDQNLAWQPQSSNEQVVVGRAAQPIGSDEIAQRLLDAIGERESTRDA